MGNEPLKGIDLSKFDLSKAKTISFAEATKDVVPFIENVPLLLLGLLEEEKINYNGIDKTLVYNQIREALKYRSGERVIPSEWRGIRNTRYTCPSCKKSARNNEAYCYKCGQKLVFPDYNYTQKDWEWPSR